LRLSEKKVDGKKHKGKAKKKPRRDSDDSTSEDADDLDWVNPGGDKKVPKPGQFAHCEICDTRFTVTPYSKTGPNGGLVCKPCGQELGADAAESKKKAATKAAATKKKRAAQSDRLDGVVQRGGKPLLQMCIETVLKYHDSVESFENVPDHLKTRIRRLFGKHRVLTSQSLPLFLQADVTVVELFDCACKFRVGYLNHVLTVGRPQNRRLQPSLHDISASQEGHAAQRMPIQGPKHDVHHREIAAYY
jgi:DNA repair protein RAD7